MEFKTAAGLGGKFINPLRPVNSRVGRTSAYNRVEITAVVEGNYLDWEGVINRIAAVFYTAVRSLICIAIQTAIIICIDVFVERKLLHFTHNQLHHYHCNFGIIMIVIEV